MTNIFTIICNIDTFLKHSCLLINVSNKDSKKHIASIDITCNTPNAIQDC
ncbi:hypothetical protein Hanom_Chr10g00910091 [Helianthus anomalus]